MVLNLTYWNTVYDISGLHGLIALGADIEVIRSVRETSRRRLGITEEHDKAAYVAYENAEKVGYGYIITLPHKHLRSITDFMLGSIKEFIAIAPDGNVVVHPFPNLQAKYEEAFGKRKASLIDDHYLIFGSKFKDEALRIFRSYQTDLYNIQQQKKEAN